MNGKGADLDAALASMLDVVRADLADHPDDKIGRRATRLGKALHIGDKWAIHLVHVERRRAASKLPDKLSAASEGVAA